MFIFIYFIYSFYFDCIFLWILFQESMCAWIPMSMSKRVGERERERDPSSSKLQPLWAVVPSSYERERESRYSQERRGEREKKRIAGEKRASLVPSAGHFLWSLGRGRQVRRSLHLCLAHLLVWLFFCFSPLSGGEFWGSEGIRRGRMVNNLTECEEVEAAANSQGEWRNLWRSHPRSSAHTHPLTLTREWSIQMEGGFEPQVRLLLPTTGPLLSYCMAVVSGIVIGGCSCVCSCSEPHRVPLCFEVWYTNAESCDWRGTSHYRHTVITPLVET